MATNIVFNSGWTWSLGTPQATAETYVDFRKNATQGGYAANPAGGTADWTYYSKVNWTGGNNFRAIQIFGTETNLTNAIYFEMAQYDNVWSGLYITNTYDSTQTNYSGNNGYSFSDSTFPFGADSWHKIVKSGTTLSWLIYADAARTDLRWTLTVSINQTRLYPYYWTYSLNNGYWLLSDVSEDYIVNATVTPSVINATAATVAPTVTTKHLPAVRDVSADVTRKTVNIVPSKFTWDTTSRTGITVTNTAIEFVNAQPGETTALISKLYPLGMPFTIQGHWQLAITSDNWPAYVSPIRVFCGAGESWQLTYLREAGDTVIWARAETYSAITSQWITYDLNAKAVAPTEFWYTLSSTIDGLITINIYTDSNRTTLWGTHTAPKSNTVPYDYVALFGQSWYGVINGVHDGITITEADVTPKVTVNTTVIGVNGNDLTLMGTFTGTAKTATGVSFTDAAATPRGYYYASRYTSIYNPEDAVKFRGHLDFTTSGTGDYAFVFWALKNNPTNAYLQFYCGLDGTTPCIFVNAATPNVARHTVVSNPPQEIWYEIVVEASGYTFNVYSDVTRETLIGTYYIDYPHTNPTWVLADNQNLGTRTFTGEHDAIEIVQYAQLNVKSLQPTSVWEVKPKKYDLINVEEFTKVGASNFTVSGNSYSCTGITLGSRTRFYSIYKPNVGTHHVGHVSWSASGDGAILVAFHKYTHEVVGQPYIMLCVSRPTGSGAPVFYWTHTDPTHYSTKINIPAEFWYEVICDANYLWTVRIYTDAAMTTLWYAESYQDTNIDYPYFNIYDDNQSANTITLDFAQDTIANYGEINFPILTLPTPVRPPWMAAITPVKKVTELPAHQPTYLPDYTLNDAGANLTVSDYGVSGTAVRTTTSQIYRDFGVNGIRDFTLEFKCSASGTPVDGAIAPMLVGNTTANAYTQSQGTHCIRPSIMRTNGGKWYLHLIAPNAGTAIAQEISASTDYWVRINRNGSTLTMDVYSDQAMQIPVGTQQTTTCQTESFRYFFPFNSYTDNQADRDFAFNFDEMRLLTPVYVTAELQAPTIIIVSNIYQATTLDVTVDVVAPTFTEDLTVAPSVINVTATVIDPELYGLPVVTDVHDPLVIVIVNPDALDPTVALETPAIIIDGSIITPDVIDVTAAVIAPTIITDHTVVVSVINSDASVIAPTLHVTIETTTIDALAAVVAPTINTVNIVTPAVSEVTAEVLTPLVHITVATSTLDVSVANTGTPAVIFEATTLDTIGEVLAPLYAMTFIPTVVNVQTTAWSPLVFGFAVTVDVETPTPLVTVATSTLDAIAEVQPPTVEFGQTVLASTVDAVAAILAPVPVVMPPASPQDASGSVLDPIVNKDATITPDTLDVIVAVLQPSMNGSVTITPDTLGVTADLQPVVLVVSMTPQTQQVVATTQPLVKAVTVAGGVTVTASIGTQQFVIRSTPGSLTITTQANAPNPWVKLSPNTLDVDAQEHYERNAVVTPDVMDVLAELWSPIPRVTWFPDPLNVIDDLYPPTIDVKNPMGEWYYKLINTGGY